ncbi:MAG TPA: hypothetical protein VM821_07995 [Abditibacteriaceae bacterium]|jgi:hypothetical protein|nr:hypothetical protein [Abditibacteriaceae bacterium]
MKQEGRKLPFEYSITVSMFRHPCFDRATLLSRKVKVTTKNRVREPRFSSVGQLLMQLFANSFETLRHVFKSENTDLRHKKKPHQNQD